MSADKGGDRFDLKRGRLLLDRGFLAEADAEKILQVVEVQYGKQAGYIGGKVIEGLPMEDVFRLLCQHIHPDTAKVFLKLASDPRLLITPSGAEGGGFSVALVPHFGNGEAQAWEDPSCEYELRDRINAFHGFIRGQGLDSLTEQEMDLLMQQLYAEKIAVTSPIILDRDTDLSSGWKTVSGFAVSMEDSGPEERQQRIFYPEKDWRFLAVLRPGITRQEGRFVGL